MYRHTIFVIYFFFCIVSYASDSGFIADINCEQNTFGAQKAEGHLSAKENVEALKALQYPSEISGWDEHGRNVSKITQIPQVGLKVRGGWLVGSNRGEWGGEAVFIHDGGNPELLVNDNIEDIYAMPFGYVITAGLAHLSLNSGTIYVVRVADSGPSKTEVLFSLSGEPKTSWKLSDGSLLINMRDSSVLLDKKGNLHRVSCISY